MTTAVTREHEELTYSLKARRLSRGDVDPQVTVPTLRPNDGVCRARKSETSSKVTRTADSGFSIYQSINRSDLIDPAYRGDPVYCPSANEPAVYLQL